MEVNAGSKDLLQGLGKVMDLELAITVQLTHLSGIMKTDLFNLALTAPSDYVSTARVKLVLVRHQLTPIYILKAATLLFILSAIMLLITLGYY